MFHLRQLWVCNESLSGRGLTASDCANAKFWKHHDRAIHFGKRMKPKRSHDCQQNAMSWQKVQSWQQFLLGQIQWRLDKGERDACPHHIVKDRQGSVPKALTSIRISFGPGSCVGWDPDFEWAAFLREDSGLMSGHIRFKTAVVMMMMGKRFCLKKRFELKKNLLDKLRRGQTKRHQMIMVL